jgi:hypothetical protein
MYVLEHNEEIAIPETADVIDPYLSRLLFCRI